MPYSRASSPRSRGATIANRIATATCDRLKVAGEHVERRQPAGARCARDAITMSSVARSRLIADGELAGRAPAREPEQAGDLVGERRPHRVRLADPPAVPRLGDRDRGARADQLQAQIDRLRDLRGGRGRRDRDRIEPHQRRVGELLDDLDRRRARRSALGDLGDHLDRDRVALDRRSAPPRRPARPVRARRAATSSPARGAAARPARRGARARGRRGWRARATAGRRRPRAR